ncbi:unnamed protein product [Caenorhabditis angaria]|uniref:GPI transamidase component PIG-S n=1 Tax=Caenorhabditis angaria TaxID=860376 RepID=A0A9P1IP80_9PELO|nr:unnamed protein product [Caenorhabditis angaria]
MRKKILDFLLGRSDEAEIREEENFEISEEFKTHIYNERPFKFVAVFSFFILVFGIGLPLWTYTTSTYRANFKIPPANRTFSIPIHVRFLISENQKSLQNELKSTILEIETSLALKESTDPMNFEFSTEVLIVKAENEEDFEKFDDGLNIAIIPAENWKDFSATKIKLGKKYTHFAQFDGDLSKFSSRIIELIWDVLIDIPHLNSIIKRDLRQKMKPWQIAALPLSHQKRLVWDSTPIQMEYHVQIIHLYDNFGTSQNKNTKENKFETAKTLRQFAKHAERITNIEVTSENLWDFEITKEFLMRDVQERWVLTHEKMEELIRKIDAQTQTTLKNGMVLRFVILESDIVILDSQGEDVEGIAVAAWGAVLTRNEKTEKKAIAALRIHLGLDAELSSSWSRPPIPLCKWEIERARLRVSIDNAMRTSSSIRALYEMTQKITNIVINEEVARKATKAVELLENGLKNGTIDYDKLLLARKLSDDANSNHSLLALLYFPMDQRTAVLIPIAIPILFPIAKIVLVIFKKCILRDFV